MIEVGDGKIHAFEVGQGPPIVFLHGGPGDTHHYMYRMAEPLFQNFRAIFFDQRGCGKSTGFPRTSESYRLPLLLADLYAIQEHFGAKGARLVGHSWGAMYALYALLDSPQRFSGGALLSMGPLNAEMERATSEHLISVLDEVEKHKWRQLRADRNRARDEGRFLEVETLDRELMGLRVKAWVHNPALRASYLEEFFSDPPTNREVNKWVWEGQQGAFEGKSLQHLKLPLWICTGANDSVPVAQSKRIAREAPNARLSIYPDCGHIPWLEHPETFYRDLREQLHR